MQESDPHGKNPHEPGAKLDDGKIMAGLCIAGFSRALTEVSKVTTYGAKKYTPNGWCKVENGIQRYSDAMYRHLLAEQDDFHDAESGLLHAAHAAWNALARLELYLRQTQGPVPPAPDITSVAVSGRWGIETLRIDGCWRRIQANDGSGDLWWPSQDAAYRNMGVMSASPARVVRL